MSTYPSSRSSTYSSPLHVSGSNRPGWLMKVLALVLLSSVALHAADKNEYAEIITLTPREGSGLGTLSTYAGIAPVFEKDATGADAIKIPASGVKELSLVWTFWRHKQPFANDWPSGKGARSVFTLESESDIILRLRVTVRTDEWSELIPSPEINLQAGKPTRVELILPEAPASASIKQVRVIFNAFEKIPELKITDWSVGRIGAISSDAP